MPTVSQPAYKALEHLLSDGKLIAKRTYPFPHRYYLVRSADELIASATPEVTTGCVMVMVDRGWLRPHPLIDTWDLIEYDLTDAGRWAHANCSQTKKKETTASRGAE